jgi:hypothetical protein
MEHLLQLFLLFAFLTLYLYLFMYSDFEGLIHDEL